MDGVPGRFVSRMYLVEANLVGAPLKQFLDVLVTLQYLSLKQTAPMHTLKTRRPE